MSTYDVRFIRGWNDSFDLTEEDITPSDLKYKTLDYDPERYLSEDFFLREAREAKISFTRHSFIIEHYVEPPANELIDVVLYTDQDGNVIDESQYDPETDKKEVIIEKYSKILIKIIQEDEVVFLGLVKTVEVEDGASEVVLTCVDFLDLIDKFASQLTYNIPGEDSYGYYFSKGIIEDLLTKIENMTGLNLNYTISPDIFLQYVSEYTVYPSPNLDPANISFDPPQYSGFDYTAHTEVRRIASVKEKAVIFYQVFRYWYALYGVNYLTSIKWKKYTPGHGWSDVQEDTYEMRVDYGTGNFDDFIDNVERWISEWLGEKEAGQLFLYPPKDFYYIDGDHLVRFHQTWYSAAIPYKTGQHKYLELIKVITLANNVTIYQKNDTIFFSIRTALPEGDTVDLNNKLIRKPFSAAGVYRDDREFDALDILWEDPCTEYQKNIEHIKEVYSTIFGEVYDKELTTSIRRYYPHTLDEVPICLGCKIRFVRDNRLQTFLIISHKRMRFYHEVRGYRTGVEHGKQI